MKIAVTYQDGDIFQHFGHTEFFKIYDIENTDIVKTEIVSTNGSGHGALAQFLHEHSVDTLICGGIGGGAQMALSQAGISNLRGFRCLGCGSLFLYLAGASRFAFGYGGFFGWRRRCSFYGRFLGCFHSFGLFFRSRCFLCFGFGEVSVFIG